MFLLLNKKSQLLLLIQISEMNFLSVWKLSSKNFLTLSEAPSDTIFRTISILRDSAQKLDLLSSLLSRPQRLLLRKKSMKSRDSSRLTRPLLDQSSQTLLMLMLQLPPQASQLLLLMRLTELTQQHAHLWPRPTRLLDADSDQLTISSSDTCADLEVHSTMEPRTTLATMQTIQPNCSATPLFERP